MKKLSFILPIFLIAFAFQACKTTEEAIDPKEKVSKAPDESPEVAFEELPVGSDSTADRSLFANIERTFCFGTCPVYTMKIYSDGFVEYEGTRNLKMIGKFTATISSSKVSAILEKADEIKFFTFEDEYDDKMVMDLPSATTMVVGHDGKQKSVMRRINYPNSLLTLEKLFDDLLESERWFDENGEAYPPER
jgi:hypothetical protein